MAKFTWKVWLYQNKLTEDPTDYVAEVDTAGRTRTQQDIIDRISEAGSEITPETIKAILDRVNHVKQNFLLEGYGINDGLVHLSPRVTGSWTGRETFTEGKHKTIIEAVATKQLHEALKDVGVEVLGVSPESSDILLVTDIATGKTDGTITRGDDIIIAGNKIKVIGKPQPDGRLEPYVGVFFFHPASNKEFQATRISENNPSRVIARVPEEAFSGQYELHIGTRYSGSNLLKDIRVIKYGINLIVP